MLTSVRGLFAATLLAGCAIAATPAFADETDAPSEFTVTGNAAVVSDYRFRGLSQSGGDPAIQGGVNVNHSSGFYVGTWGSSIQGADRSVLLDDGTGVVGSYGNGSFGSMELDLFGGWSGEVSSGVTADVGILYYIYPNAKNRTALAFGGPVGPSGYPVFAGYANYNTDFLEPYASVSATFGPVTGKVGVAYAWDQSALGDDDNLYLYTDLSAAIPDSPITIGGHLGWTDGVLSPNYLTGKSTKSGFDYSLTGTITMTKNLSFSLSYVGVDGAPIDSYSDDAAVASLKVSF